MDSMRFERDARRSIKYILKMQQGVLLPTQAARYRGRPVVISERILNADEIDGIHTRHSHTTATRAIGTTRQLNDRRACLVAIVHKHLSPKGLTIAR